MIDLKFSLPSCKTALAELKILLATKPELDETGPDGLQEFFWERPALLLLMGKCFGPTMKASSYQREFSIFNEFRADFAVCNQTKDRFLFVEFEDAKSDSVFAKKADGARSVSYQWSPRFEHGFSQVVDWHFRMHDYRRTSKLEEHFGSQPIAYIGILVIGRDQHVKGTGNSQRLAWRRETTVIDSEPLRCLTFDELAFELEERLTEIDDFIADTTL